MSVAMEKIALEKERRKGNTMRIRLEETQALMIDFQKRLMPVIEDQEAIIERASLLLSGLSVLKVPVTVTCQYQKGLGETIDSLYTLLEDTEQFDKMSFSCMEEPPIRKRITERPALKNVLVFGVEAHICVLQTVTDLAELGFVPVVVLDCIGSRRKGDKDAAIRRMEQEGAVFTTAESILYELTRKAGDKKFKEISRLTK